MIYRLSMDAPMHIGMVGHIRYRTNRVRQNCYTKNVLVYLLNGRMIYEPRQGERVKICAGMHLIIPAGQPYRLVVEEECDYYYAHFALSEDIVGCEERQVREHLDREAHLQQQARSGNYSLGASHALYVASHGHHGEREDSVRYHISRCEEFRYGSAALDRFRLEHAFFKVLLSLAAALEEELLVTQPFSPLLSKILQFIKTNYAQQITLSELSQRFQVSKQYIMRLFREGVGMTVTHYITELRLGKSVELLTHTPLSVSEVAYAVGYEDPHYFDRLFKKAYGITPTQFQVTQNP